MSRQPHSSHRAERIAERLDEDAPDSPTELHGRSWRFAARRSVREFLDDECLDLAAALTYYAVLALAPAALALLALLGVVGQADESVDTVLEVLGPLVSSELLATIEPTLRDLAASDAAGTALVLGVLTALWSASGYVGAFGRAMNRIYEVEEGRPFWKLRPLSFLVTLVSVLLLAVVLVLLVVSGPVAASVGDVVGLGEQAQLVFSVARWPVIAVAVVVVVALLYYATPNVRQPAFRWISVGAAAAILVWIAASVAFAVYLATFADYSKTYGSLASVVVALLFLWITNLALLLGAEIDSELERSRELQAGVPAERELQLPPRDTRTIEKAQRREAEAARRGREIREQAAARHAEDLNREEKESTP